ncbi:alpha/beta fold hydrolase [Paenibacillus popilliae]|uniref:Alpha/beta hydrolase n=1 Tax=Paenibacillus popilliae TaxID=78057 RepID=A0ABY3AM58_PAEPP|nr:alpha/beta hydrolase [Paenibacillus sp. SDF0028]TQR43577.1 alpha/beta hydrolase [Paenibacillus sp. SDF0028]
MKRRNDQSKIGRYVSEMGKANFEAAYWEAMKLLPEPQETLDIETSFGSVRSYLFTKPENQGKEPLLLLPGRSASTPMWAPNLHGLMKERPVYTLDLLGEPGMSRQSKPIRSSVDQASWLSEALASLGVEAFHLVGVSIGGWTAVNLARYTPSHLSSISLLDPVFVFAPLSLKMIAASIPAAVPIVPRFIRQKMLSYISGGAKADESEPIAKLIGLGMRSYKISLPSPVLFSKEQLLTIDVPILALMAKNSAMHDSEMAVRQTSSYAPHIQIECWPNASHAINGEFPDEVSDRILAFINQQ